jgi:hypothetical protein
MADEGGGSGPSTTPAVPSGGAPSATTPKKPGWYPVRSNPNQQSYWDGTDWTGRRHWTVGAGWTEVGVTPDFVPVAEPEGPTPRLSANPYTARTQPRTPTAAAAGAPGVTVANFLLLASGITVMLASVTTWVSSSVSSLGSVGGRGASLSLSSATSGVDPSISAIIGLNGYVTLTAGVVLVVFAGMMMASNDPGIRTFAAFFALVTVGFGIYVVVRLLQKINELHVPQGASVDLGWGAILVLGAAIVAALLAISQLRTR